MTIEGREICRLYKSLFNRPRRRRPKHDDDGNENVTKRKVYEEKNCCARAI